MRRKENWSCFADLWYATDVSKVGTRNRKQTERNKHGEVVNEWREHVASLTSAYPTLGHGRSFDPLNPGSPERQVT